MLSGYTYKEAFLEFDCDNPIKSKHIWHIPPEYRNFILLRLNGGKLYYLLLFSVTLRFVC